MNPAVNAAPDTLDRLIVTVKWMAAGLGAAIAGTTFGARTVLVGLVVLMAIDWVTGFNAAYIRGEISSEVGKKGLVLKGQILLLILAVHVLEKMSGYELQLELWGAGGFCINEAISIVENVARSGVRIPQQLVQALLKVKALSPRPATREELDQLRDETRAQFDAGTVLHRREVDATQTEARAETDAAAAKGSPTSGLLPKQ